MINKRTRLALDVLPTHIKELILKKENEITDNLEEIRLRIGAPVLLYLRRKEIYLTDELGSSVIINEQDILKIVNNITKNSLYVYLEDIKNGFVTIPGGHRVGLCGTAVCENGKIINIKDIKYINLRIAREIIGVSDNLMNNIYVNGYLKNTLIISPPQAGKTTLIRDIIRNLSKHPMMKIVLIDERNEIGAVYMGVPQNDVGIRTFVLSGYSKRDGFIHAVRSLSPTVIACDELGTLEDVKTIKRVINEGVKIIATVHGNSVEEILKKEEFKGLINEFEYIITLNKNDFKISGGDFKGV